ncbi:hypothetical protein VNO77_44386 [Canavalia gladiata]|uniref:Uncharacterized protein n=1 Tax=Canavalia gladiata TaxID=3824 RepID=A0AAN9JY04_CANGL
MGEIGYAKRPFFSFPTFRASISRFLSFSVSRFFNRFLIQAFSLSFLQIPRASLRFWSLFGVLLEKSLGIFDLGEQHQAFQRKLLRAQSPGIAKFGSGEPPGIENWKVAMTLREHTTDVNGTCMTVLRGHRSLVTGVPWDPIGFFIASQSDDKTVIIGKISDKSLAHRTDGHWAKSFGSTFSKKLGWSPCGAFYHHHSWFPKTEELLGYSRSVKTITMSIKGKLQAQLSGPFALHSQKDPGSNLTH